MFPVQPSGVELTGAVEDCMSCVPESLELTSVRRVLVVGDGVSACEL